jgi:serine/threonine protein kinase
MGVVFEAVHEHMGQRAAVKVLSPELSRSPRWARRFLDEARAASKVRHAGLVQIFDCGTLPDGVAYILMEHLSGESLRARLGRAGGPLPYDEALQLARQLAAALRAVHEGNIVHRDLKPDNIILVPNPESAGGERAKLLDFGIAFGGQLGPGQSRWRRARSA